MSPRHVTTESEYLTGIFRDRASAERAYDALVRHGYTHEEINVIMSEETRKRYFTGKPETGSKAAEGGLAGAAVGGAAGAIAGALALAGTLAIPGIGIVLAGPLAAALAGLGAGAATGGLVGALIGSGIPEEHAKTYEMDVKTGNILLSVRPRSDRDAHYIEDVLREYGEVRFSHHHD